MTDNIIRPIQFCECCQGTGNVVLFPDSYETHPCSDCRPNEFREWQGQPDEATMAELWAEDARYRNRLRWRAFASIFRPKEWAEGNDWRNILMLAACAVALLLGRERTHKSDEKYPTYRYRNITNWDYRPLYAGWEIQCLDFHPRAFRYHIFEDGDWNM